MAGMPQSQREQILAAVGFLGIVAAGAYWYFLFQPKAAELDTLRTRVERLDASNQRAKALLARGTVEELRAEAQRLKDNLDRMRTLIPAENEVPALLDQIIGAARRTGLDVQSFAPGATLQGEEFDTHRYGLNINGTYHEIASLLTEIGSLPRIIAPVNVRLAPMTAVNMRRVAPDQRLLTASFDIQTYVVRAGPAAETTP